MSRRFKRIYIISFVLLTLIIILIGVAGYSNFRDGDHNLCNESYRNDASGYEITAGQRLDMQVVRSGEERVRGLSGKLCIVDTQAMLFIFNEPADHGIWMKDMRFGIDIVWLDVDRKITHIENNVQPDSYPYVYRPGSPSLYVLELGAGQAQRIGLQTGQQLNLPL